MSDYLQCLARAMVEQHGFVCETKTQLTWKRLTQSSVRIIFLPDRSRNYKHKNGWRIIMDGGRITLFRKSNKKSAQNFSIFRPEQMKSLKVLLLEIERSGK